MSRLELMPNTVLPSQVVKGEFRPGEVRVGFVHTFAVTGNPIVGGIVVASGTAWIPSRAMAMQARLAIFSKPASWDKDAAWLEHGNLQNLIFSDILYRFGNTESTHHTFPTLARSIARLAVGDYVVTVRSNDVETWIDGNDRWDISLLY